MAIKICLQSGHFNKPGGGAPNEQATNKRITDRLSDMLRQRGFLVTQTDWYANNDPVVTKTDFKLFLALHCDMDYPNDGGSGFADFAEPSTDSATSESQRICKVINETYFPEVKINYVNHSNANTRFYYMWKSLTPKTPCVLLEMGQSIDPHDKVLLANTDLIANAIAMCIDKTFGFTVPTPTDCLNYIKEISDLKLYQKELETQIAELSTQALTLSETNQNLTESLDSNQKEVADWQYKFETANQMLTEQIVKLEASEAQTKFYKKKYQEALISMPKNPSWGDIIQIIKVKLFNL